jgi:transcriptional regulator with XRE-family HTH domain
MHDGIRKIVEALEMDELARGRLVELLRKVQGDRSQADFAKELKVSTGAYQNWLAGRIPSTNNMEKIAKAAGMSIQELHSAINGEPVAQTFKTANEVLQIALQLDNEQLRRLAKLLIDHI